MAKKKLEREQYAALKNFLTGVGCNQVIAAGDGIAVKLHIGERRRRIPDVVGARRVKGAWEVWAIEAKREVGGGAAADLGLAHVACAC